MTVPDTLEHRARIAQRMAGVFENVEARMAPLEGLSRATEARMMAQAAQATTVTQRVHWLWRAADAGTQAATKIAACRQGCTHCCHQSVVVSKAEARVIAKATGAKLNTQAGQYGHETEDLEAARDALRVRFTGSPCVFLKSGSCSIYAHRPLVCRWHLNMDADDLLCQIVDGGEPPVVPYLDMSQQEMHAVLILGLHQSFDDIREWFKAPVNKEGSHERN